VKKVLKWTLLFTLTFLFASQLMAADIMGQVAIFNEQVGWINAATAQAQTKIFVDGVKLARDIQVLGDADIAKWAKANTDDGNLDIIITFGYFPTSLYTPGNAQANDSVGELFLEGGDMFLNTADYVFYVTAGGGANGDVGLKNMTDSAFDCWTDGTITAPTDDGKKYIPSLPNSITAPRCFRSSQIDADQDWEIEIAFAEAGDNSDPAIIRNLTYGGRVGIFFQVSDDAYPRGKVLIELFDNWLKEVARYFAVDPQSKMATTWSSIKND